MNAAPVIVPSPFAISMPSSRTPVPSKRSDAVAFWIGSPYATPSSIRHGPGADRPAALALQPELARHPARQRVLVDLKRVAQAVEIAARDAEPRIDLVAAVLTRGRERKQAVGVNFRIVHAARCRC